MNNHFGTMPYNPNFACDTTPGTNESYAISPLDIQVCYKKLFDIYKGAFPNQEGGRKAPACSTVSNSISAMQNPS